MLVGPSPSPGIVPSLTDVIFPLQQAPAAAAV